jgi:predicted heme/steroid binding protein
MHIRKFTKAKLRQSDGKHGAAALIAYGGKVYDVTQSFLWQGGAHQVLHPAGIDLTGELAHAPHGEDLLERFPMVGLLVD